MIDNQNLPSIDALIFLLLVSAYLPFRFITEQPQVVPFNRPLTAFVLLFLIIYWVTDLSSISERWAVLIKWTSVLLTIGIVIVASTLSAVLLRQQSDPHLYAHDGLIQSEAAVDYIMDGKNPYVEDYFGTPMENWEFFEGGITLNPALYHYIYMPVMFMLPFVFETILGSFDHRLIFLLAFAGTLFLSAVLATRPQHRLILTMILGLNPVFASFIVDGRNDVLVLFWIMLGLVFLIRGKNRGAAVWFAIACASKQSAWFLIPFFFIYVAGDGALINRFKTALWPVGIFSVVFGLLILPWLLSAPQPFIEDTLLFQSGAVGTGYVITGVGFSTWLIFFGVVDSIEASFPFSIFQAVFGLTIMAIYFRKLWFEQNIKIMLMGFAILLFGVTFFSRAFNNNYLGMISSIIALAVLIDSTPSKRNNDQEQQMLPV